MATPPKTDVELAEAHKYKLLNGDVAINVTAISGLMDDGKSGAFAGAAVKLAREGKNYREEWKAKAERGSRIHAHLESFLKSEDAEVCSDETGYVDALEKFIMEHQPKVLEMEAICLSDHGYGGRFDLLATLNDGFNWLLDLKTGNQYAVEHTLQLSAYRYSDGIAVYGEDGGLSSLRPMPEIHKTGCLYVKDDGTYKIVEYPADFTAFCAFLNLLDAYKWTRTTTMKQATKESKIK